MVLEGPTSDDDWIVIWHEVKRLWPDALMHRVGSGEAMIYRDLQGSRDVPARVRA